MRGTALFILMLSGTTMASPAVRDTRAVAEDFVAARHPWQSLQALIKADPIPRDERFTRCGKPLEAFLPAGTRVGSRTTIGIRCGDEQGWTLYLPVSLQVFADVLVAGTTLTPNQSLQPGQVETKRRDIAGLGYGYLTSLPTEGNWRVRQIVQAGQALTPNDLQPDTLIRRGQTVSLRVKLGDIEISQRGEALSDAPLRGRLQVRNRESGRVVDGLVVSESLVDVR